MVWLFYLLGVLIFAFLVWLTGQVESWKKWEPRTGR